MATGKAISEYRTGSAVAAPTREQSDLLSKFWNRIEQIGGRYQIADNVLWTPAEYSALHLRMCECERALTSAQDHEIKVLVLAMFLGFPSLRLAKDEADRMSALWVSQLRDFPAWTIKQACENALQDRISGRSADFVPSVAVIASECAKLVQPTRDERGKLKALVDADVYHAPTDDERARVKAGFEKLIADLKLRDPFTKSAVDTGPLDPGAVTEKLLEERDARPAPELSKALRGKLGAIADQYDARKAAAE